MHYCFVVNGRPGKEHIYRWLLKELEELSAPIDSEIHLTTAPKEATSYVGQYMKDHPGQPTCFVACGGDGTLNEVATAMVGCPDEFCMSFLPHGSGNDFAKYFYGRDYSRSRLTDVLEGTPRRVDIIRVNDSYALNICNFGFDSKVAEVANRLTITGRRRRPYRCGVFAAIFTARFNRIRVVADGELLTRRRMLLCTLANAAYVGGEYHCAPKARIDDGLIDVCLFHSMPLLAFIFRIKLYTYGKHLGHPRMRNRMEYRQVSRVELSSDQTFAVCVDGEMIYGDRFDCRLLPAAVTLVEPKVAPTES